MLYVDQQIVREILSGTADFPAFPGVAIHDANLATSLRGLCRALEFGRPCLATETQLLSELRTLLLRYTQAKSRESRGHEPVHVAQTQEYLRANLHRNVTLQELANLTGLSKA
jgi:hypothetical protein